MSAFRVVIIGAVLVTSGILDRAAAGQTPGPSQPPSPQLPVVTERVEVVTSKLPESPKDVPAAIEVILGQELRDRGATNLHDALALAAGVDVAPGGDTGPAGSVPEFWGLREFDAFLLIVDDIPWGGAFNPALTTLNLQDVDRIEILRGPAPVTYGATSFVGVIHVVHNAAAATRRYATARVGNYKTGGAAVDLPLTFLGSWKARLGADVDRQGFADERTSYARGHALLRAEKGDQTRGMWFSIDVNLLRQHPASPKPVEGAAVSPEVPIDANANPAGAFMNEDRIQFAWGMRRPVMTNAGWVTTASFSRSAQRAFRGFLTEIADVPDNATGLRQNITLTDLYVDSHVDWPERAHVRFTVGGDYLHGKGNSVGAVFDYTTPLDGSSATTVTEPTDLPLGSEDRREFVGGYGMAEYKPNTRLTISAGIRGNFTFEERGGSPAEEAAAKAAGEKDHGKTHAAPSGGAGVMYEAWANGANYLRVYGNYRNTFKPAAFDFGLGEAAAGGIDRDKTLLDPETAQSVEGGVKARALGGRIDVEGSVFRMAFNNLVTATTVNGLPALENSGKTRFEGFDLATDLRLTHANYARATYSFHNGRYVDFVKNVDAGPTQLAGNRVEMSARQLAAFGFVHSPATGVVGSVTVKITGNRYLDEINSALAPAFATLDVGAGYRLRMTELRLDVHNIGDRRDPVALSELGDGQVYLMTSRQFVVTLGHRF